jgi:regulator of protease activity HflC (stomatin/prohibitin superfamily)
VDRSPGRAILDMAEPWESVKMTMSELAHFNNAARHRVSVTLLGLLLALFGLALLAAVLSDIVVPWRGGIRMPPGLGYFGASLLIAAAGLLSAGLVVEGRLAVGARPILREPEVQAGGQARFARRAMRQIGALRPQRGWLAAWPQVLMAMLFGVLALVGTIATARLASRPAALDSVPLQLLGGSLILFAFPFLVLERLYANTASETLPDAPQLERLMRVPLTACLALGIVSVLQSLGFEWPLLIQRAIALVIGIVALEIVLRAAAMLFVPFAPIETRRAVADSSVASLLRLTPPSLSSVGGAVKRQFGIDLSRSWALAFVRQATFPIALFMAVVAWVVSGLTALGMDERAVYERLGVPVTVFGPGLHVHLPWPLGIVRRVELGTVHEIPVVFSAVGDRAAPVAAATEPAAPATGRAEDLPPASADRLWDASHPSEASYLIASETQGKQSFQIVNIDLRVVYRTGLSEQAAKQAAYAVSEPDALIRAQAGELLVRYFARYTLLDVLGQSRESFTNEFRAELQDGLTKLGTGIDVIAVIVEAIHPPPGAANAYHYVQAAEILAKSEIALRRADASRRLKSAQQTAMEDRNEALATSAEQVNRARADSVLFQGDRQAYQQDGRVFLFERWLARLGSGLAKSSFIAVDHRLKGGAAPTIDLRSFAPGSTPDAPTPGMGSSQGNNAPTADDAD